jgi:hypothetical protein
VLNEEGDKNGWDDMGTFLHDIMEKYLGGELKNMLECQEYFYRNWRDRVVDNFPRFNIDLYTHYFNKMPVFFDVFEGIKGKILSVEEYIETELPSGLKFRGYIDVISERNSEVSIIDWKSFNPNNYSKDELDKKSRQLYLYAYMYYKKYGKYPKHLVFWLFQVDKKNGEYANETRKIYYSFSEDRMWEVVEWADKTAEFAAITYQKFKNIKKGSIIVDSFYSPEKDKLNKRFCTLTCSYRNNCIFKDEYFPDEG